MPFVCITKHIQKKFKMNFSKPLNLLVSKYVQTIGSIYSKMHQKKGMSAVEANYMCINNSRKV